MCFFVFTYLENFMYGHTPSCFFFCFSVTLVFAIVLKTCRFLFTFVLAMCMHGFYELPFSLIVSYLATLCSFNDH